MGCYEEKRRVITDYYQIYGGPSGPPEKNMITNEKVIICKNCNTVINTLGKDKVCPKCKSKDVDVVDKFITKG